MVSFNLIIAAILIVGFFAVGGAALVPKARTEFSNILSDLKGRNNT